MIKTLQSKYPLTWGRFVEYLRKFDTIDTHRLEFSIGGRYLEVASIGGDFLGEMEIPEQFLVGPMLEFFSENNIEVCIYAYIKEAIVSDRTKPGIDLYTSREEAFDKAFAILEER